MNAVVSLPPKSSQPSVSSSGLSVVRQVPLLERPDATGVAEHVRVCGAGRRIEHRLGVGGLESLGELGGLHVPVAVPLGLAAVEAHAVDHAVTEEPVPGGARLRVRPVAQVAARQRRRDRPGHLQIERGQLLLDRRVVPLEEPRGGLGLAFFEIGHEWILSVMSMGRCVSTGSVGVAGNDSPGMAHMPPATVMIWPVTQLPASLAR